MKGWEQLNERRKRNEADAEEVLWVDSLLVGGGMRHYRVDLEGCYGGQEDGRD
jgi:hypothetical protein